MISRNTFCECRRHSFAMVSVAFVVFVLGIVFFLRGKGLSGFKSRLLGESLSSLSIKGLFGIDI